MFPLMCGALDYLQFLDDFDNFVISTQVSDINLIVGDNNINILLKARPFANFNKYF